MSLKIDWAKPGDLAGHSNISVYPTSGIGAQTLAVTVSPGASGIVEISALGAANSPQQINVSVNSVTSATPYGSFDTSIDNTTGIAGAIPVTGWSRVLVIDDWAMAPLSEPERRDFWEICEDRYQMVYDLDLPTAGCALARMGLRERMCAYSGQ